MEVKVVSREMIKPSSLMPPHPKSFKLSVLDQLHGAYYTPMVYFYHLNKTDDFDQKNEICRLKKSLSKTLSHFYLLAGRIKERSIDCNDEGALFLEASINCSMSDILKEPQYEMLGNLLPCSPICTEPIEKYAQVVAQFNTFLCGGIAISFCFLHKIIDGSTISCFLRSWASLNRKPFDSSHDRVVCFDYNAISSLFPQPELLPSPKKELPITFSSSKNSVERFVFNAKAISDLKEKAKSINISNPTTIEVVSAFISKYLMEVTSVRTAGSNQKHPYYIYHSLNLRRKMNLSQPEFCIGNMVWAVFAQYEANYKVEVELNELVNLLRQSFAKIDSDYVQKLTRQVDGQCGAISMIHEWKNEIWFKNTNTFKFVSRRNMNLNSVDFGWGKPIWVTIGGPPNMMPCNSGFLLETMSGDGIEAWLALDEEEMKLLKQNSKFLEFALINPSIPLP